MKRIASFAIVILLCISLFAVTAFAASASASLSGPGTVRAGDTITLTFNLNGSGIYGASGTLSYDSGLLELKDTKQKIGNGWAVEFSGKNFVAYDNNLAKPINSKTALFTVSFKVKSSVSTGAAIKVSYTGVTASDGNADANVGTVTYSAKVAAPMSGDNTLKSLTVSNATISPSFSPSTTSYTAEVPFEVSKLDVKAVANDGKAKVSVKSPNLTPGGTTKVTVTVAAENGSKKTYTISVKRAQDPNYKASGNNKLSGITVDGFLLSPGFDADTTQYVVWLPYETSNIKISGSAADSKASVEVVGGGNLAAGQDNPVKVICIAENGDKKEYTVIVKRAAAHDGTVETIPEETVPPTTGPEEITTPETEPAEDIKLENDTNGVAWWWLLVVGIAALAVGVVSGFFGKEFIKKEQ